MKLFAIADLHMDGGAGKPMDVFGPHWADHCGRIFAAWRELVGEGDVVLVPGDISWAMQFKDALPDLIALSELPGKKVLLRGNHDFWWSSVTRMREKLKGSVSLVQNDALDMGAFTVCGSRGWVLPSDPEFTAGDRKIYERELLRLGLSLSAAERIGKKPLVAMLHFPPALRDGGPTGFTELLERAGASLCVYGHLHGSSAWEVGFKGKMNGVRYELCSADSLGFKPKLLRCFPEPRVIDGELTLVPYYPNEEEALPWYLDPVLVKQVDDRDEPYTPELLRSMYEYLSARGDCFYIEYRGKLVGDVTLRYDDSHIAIVVSREYQNRHIGRRCVLEMLKLAREEGMSSVKAQIYPFNTQSQKMFLSVGFERVGEEEYVYSI